MKNLHFTIPLTPRTKKNNSRIIRNHRTGQMMLLPSKAFEHYQKDCIWFMPKIKEPISEPVNLKAVYYMPTRGTVDLVGLHQALQDILVHYQIIEDDNSRIIVSLDGSRVMYDKDHPGTEVWITPADSDKLQHEGKAMKKPMKKPIRAKKPIQEEKEGAK